MFFAVGVIDGLFEASLEWTLLVEDEESAFEMQHFYDSAVFRHENVDCAVILRIAIHLRPDDFGKAEQALAHVYVCVVHVIPEGVA